MEDDDDYPSEINDDLKWFNEKVEDVEETMKPLLDTSRNELIREVKQLHNYMCITYKLHFFPNCCFCFCK